MFRNPSDAPGRKTINCLLADGGIGDYIGYLTVVDYIHKTYNHINLLVWVPDYLLDLAKHVLPQELSVRNYSMAAKKYENERTGISTNWHKHSPMRTHAVDYAFHLLADESPDITKKNYLKIRPDEIDLGDIKLPEKYVVIAATSAEVVKTMPNKTINEIAQYVVSKGYTPVFIGRTETDTGYKNQVITAKAAEIDYSVGLNLVNKTSILQTAKVISGAHAFVGMDGGPTHIAGTTEVPIIVGYTFINPNHNLPIRHDIPGWNCYPVVPEEKLGCRFCQTNMNFLYDFDFRNCYYKDYQCVTHMTSDKFINHLEKIL